MCITQHHSNYLMHYVRSLAGYNTVSMDVYNIVQTYDNVYVLFKNKLCCYYMDTDKLMSNECMHDMIMV